MAYASKVIIVTGPVGSLGSSISKAFSKEGASLVLPGRNKEKLAKLAEECKAAGATQVLQVVANLRELSDLQKIVRETINEFGRLDILVNNAATPAAVGTVEQADITQFDEAFQVNVRAYFYLAQLSIPHLEKSKGCILNMSATGGQYQIPHLAVLIMTKSTIDHFTKIAALEFASKGVRVNSFAPGFLHHDRELYPGFLEYAKQEEKKSPLGGLNIKHDEVIDSVMFLTSDKAKAITGVNLVVDRGRLLTGQ